MTDANFPRPALVRSEFAGADVIHSSAAHSSAAHSNAVRAAMRRAAVRSQSFALTPDMVNGLVVIAGSLVMALMGMGLGAWLQLPFGN